MLDAVIWLIASEKAIEFNSWWNNFQGKTWNVNLYSFVLGYRSPSLCPIWLPLLCPPRMPWLLAGRQAEQWVRIREPAELQTNMSHWPGDLHDLWPAADPWPVHLSHPLHISKLGGPGWAHCTCVGVSESVCEFRVSHSAKLKAKTLNFTATTCSVICLEWLCF